MANAKKKDPWLLVQKDSWHVVGDDAQKGILKMEPLYVSFSESENASRESSCSGDDIPRIEPGDGIIFSPPEIQVTVNPKHNFVITPQKSISRQRDLLGDMLCGTERRRFKCHDFGPMDLKLEIMSEVTQEKIAYMKSENYLDIFLLEPFGRKSEKCQKASDSLNTTDIIKSCIEQIKAIDKQDGAAKTPSNGTMNAIRFFSKTVLGVSAAFFLTAMLLSKNRDNLRRWFRSAPELTFGISVVLDSIEKNPDQMLALVM